MMKRGAPSWRAATVAAALASHTAYGWLSTGASHLGVSSTGASRAVINSASFSSAWTSRAVSALPFHPHAVVQCAAFVMGLNMCARLIRIGCDRAATS